MHLLFSYTHRKIILQEYLVSALNQHGNYALLLSDFTPQGFLHQLAVATQSDVVIGLHGAGLMNIIFAPSNSVLIELKTPYGYSSDLFAVAADSRCPLLQLILSFTFFFFTTLLYLQPVTLESLMRELLLVRCLTGHLGM